MRSFGPFGPQDLGFEAVRDRRESSGVAEKYSTDLVLFVSKISPSLTTVNPVGYFLK
jgi:hypothetical protein